MSDTRHDQRRIFSRRAFFLLGLQGLTVGALGLRMRELGITRSDDLRLLAEENRINVRLVAPVRGRIYDRLGAPLADNVLSYNIYIIREQTPDPELVLRRLAEIIPISEERIQETLDNLGRTRAFLPVPVASDLTWEHIAAFAANAPALPGITAERGFKRAYPKGNEFAHIVGYVGPVSDFDLSRIDDPDPLLRIPKFLIGKNGVEANTDLSLRGSAGIRRIEVNAVGRVMRELEHSDGTPGQDLQLTIDARVQKRTTEIISVQNSASAVIMDVQNGDILAAASVPTFDPNKFVNGISVSDWNSLNNNRFRPMLNKAVSGQYPPGSTFKMIVALAALEENVVGASERIFCPGHMDQSGRRFHCWRRGGHGSVNLVEAVRSSCDVYFYEVAKRVGIDRISEIAKQFGLGTRHDVPLPAVYSGTVPNVDWKRNRFDQPWRIGDTLNAGIGQGYVLATPLELAVMTARLATGRAVTPRLVHAQNQVPLETPQAEPLSIQPQHFELIRRGMFDVSNNPRGTAYWHRPWTDAYKIAGKTGTAQVRRITLEERARGVIKNEDLPWERRDHGLFVAYAPYDAPKYAVAVVCEHGGGSGSAAPLARDILTYVMSLEDTGYRAPLKRQDITPAQEI